MIFCRNAAFRQWGDNPPWRFLPPLEEARSAFRGILSFVTVVGKAANA
jgi:hypothetical protein